MAELKPNTTLSHYRILSTLGVGGMGEVYLAEDTRLGRKVALKILSSDYRQSPERMRLFVEEAKSVLQLNHPNIASIFEIGEAAGVRFMALEFINGRTLRDRMRETPLKLEEGLDVATQVAMALGTAHAAGLVHRDIKPENIMLRQDGLVKVLDFGSPRLIPAASSESLDTDVSTLAISDPEASTIWGLTKYMSPEQASGHVDSRTDIFALGVVLYEMVGAILPSDPSVPGRLSSVHAREPQHQTSYSREVLAEFERIVSRAVRKEVADRYQTSGDLLLDLQRLRERLALETKPLSPRLKDLQASRRRQVFLSYASADKGVAREVAESLLAAGLRVRIETWELAPGDSIEQHIQEAVSSGDILLVFLSPRSINSRWVKSELSAALSKELRDRAIIVIPALIEDCEIPPLLADRVFLDLRRDFPGAVRRLVEQIGSTPNLNFSSLDWRAFEEMVADLLGKLGFNVQRTAITHDRGYDFVASYRSRDLFGAEQIETWLVETKLYRKERVSVSTLREMIGSLLLSGKGKKGLIITNSRLTSVARSFLKECNEKLGHELRVIDGTELTSLLIRHSDIVQAHFPSGGSHE